MRRHLLAVATLAMAGGLGACAGDSANDYDNDAGTSSDANTCGTAITFDPMVPVASAVAPIRAQVMIVGAPGVLTYDWTVRNPSGATLQHTMEASDNSQIGFLAPNAGPYDVTVSISGPVPAGCSFISGTVNVLAEDANVDLYRLRTVPPPNAGAPAQEIFIQIRGGGDVSRTISLDPGIEASLAVRQSNGTGVPAYVKASPVSTPYAFTEAFTAADGTFDVRLAGSNHNVLVIPQSPLFAPKLFTWSPSAPPGTTFTVGGGTLVTGTVRGPGGAGLGNAKVQLRSNGVPSTIATTGGDGSFSVRTDFAAGAMVTVEVTPALASGLPRLEATGAFSLTTAMQINYAAGLATCDLAGTDVERGTVNQANAKVTIVGTLPGTSGTVAAGPTVNAVGSVRVATVASGAGILPATLVPRAALSAVVELASGELAVDAIDTTACPSMTIDAPAQVVRTGIVRNSAAAVLGGVRVEATPVGSLALADTQTVTATTNNSGVFSLPLASGGRYDVRFVDPFARAAQLDGTGLSNIAPASVPTAPTMPKALVIKGTVSIIGSTQPVPGASVQVLCGACTGIAGTRPIAETATSSLSEYRVAVPDPGTM